MPAWYDGRATGDYHEKRHPSPTRSSILAAGRVGCLHIFGDYKAMSKKICSCGTYETIGMRAIETVGKMTDDDECVRYVAAFGHAIIAIAGAQLHSLNMLKLRREFGVGAGPHDEIFAEASLLVVEQKLTKSKDEVLEWFEQNGAMVLEKMNEPVRRWHDRRKAENDLSKGE